MANKIFLLGLFLLSVANVKAQTLTQTDSLTMETMLHNLPEVMVKGSRPIVKAERGMLSYNMPLLLKQLPADNAYEALTRIPGVSLPFIHIFDNSQHLTFAEEIVKSCFESCISWT